MKRLILTLMTTAAVAGCATTQFEKPINEYLTRNANNVDLEYESQNLNVLDTVTVKESIDNWYDASRDGSVAKDSAKTRLRKTIAVYKSVNNYTDTSRQLEYAQLKHRYERIEDLESRKLTSIDFYVVQNTFSIKNPVDGSWQMPTRYYIIDKKKNVLAEMDETRYNNLTAQYSKATMYERALFEAKYKPSVKTTYP